MSVNSARGAIATWLLVVLGAVVSVAGIGGFGYWYYLKRDVPVRYSDPIERFKYQSIGDEVTGIPYYIWKVLPAICAEYLPEQGYAGFGFTFEPGHERPVGVTLRTVGIPRAGINCATCHTGTIRKTPDAPREVLLGSPSHQLDLQAYARFLLKCVASDNYQTDTVMAAIQRNEHLGPLDSLVYRYAIVPGTKSEIIRLRGRLDWFDARPDFGRGRFDAFNPVKADFGVDMTQDDSIATADYPSVWNQAPREHHALHWDASNASAAERNIAAAIGSGATPDAIDHEEIDWTTDFLKTLPPPKYPFAIDQTLASTGKPIFDTHCGRCHSLDGTQVLRTTPVATVGTDRLRYDAFDQEFADRFNTIGEGYTWKVKGYRQSDGYLNPLLDGVWARAPYLHNGSVRNLRELLEVPENRTKVFYRGYDIYDPDGVGFISLGPEAEAAGSKYDTSLRGNGNGGHIYGTDLPVEDKRALLEYLKTL